MLGSCLVSLQKWSIQEAASNYIHENQVYLNRNESYMKSNNEPFRYGTFHAAIMLSWVLFCLFDVWLRTQCTDTKNRAVSVLAFVLLVKVFWRSALRTGSTLGLFLDRHCVKIW